jgi:hypothetical protein
MHLYALCRIRPICLPGASHTPFRITHDVDPVHRECCAQPYVRQPHRKTKPRMATHEHPPSELRLCFEHLLSTHYREQLAMSSKTDLLPPKYLPRFKKIVWKRSGLQRRCNTRRAFASLRKLTRFHPTSANNRLHRKQCSQPFLQNKMRNGVLRFRY